MFGCELGLTLAAESATFAATRGSEGKKGRNGLGEERSGRIKSEGERRWRESEGMKRGSRRKDISHGSGDAGGRIGAMVPSLRGRGRGQIGSMTVYVTMGGGGGGGASGLDINRSEAGRVTFPGSCQEDARLWMLLRGVNHAVGRGGRHGPIWSRCQRDSTGNGEKGGGDEGCV